MFVVDTEYCGCIGTPRLKNKLVYMTINGKGGQTGYGLHGYSHVSVLFKQVNPIQLPRDFIFMKVSTNRKAAREWLLNI